MHNNNKHKTKEVSMFNPSSEKILAYPSPLTTAENSNENTERKQNTDQQFQDLKLQLIPTKQRTNGSYPEEPQELTMAPQPEILLQQLNNESMDSIANSARNSLMSIENLNLNTEIQQQSSGYKNKSIEELLNSRMSLSQIRIKNEWLNDILPKMKKTSDADSQGSSQGTKRSNTYTSKNRERFEKLEQELNAKRQKLLQSQSARQSFVMTKYSNHLPRSSFGSERDQDSQLFPNRQSEEVKMPQFQDQLIIKQINEVGMNHQYSNYENSLNGQCNKSSSSNNDDGAIPAQEIVLNLRSQQTHFRAEYHEEKKVDLKQQTKIEENTISNFTQEDQTSESQQIDERNSNDQKQAISSVKKKAFNTIVIPLNEENEKSSQKKDDQLNESSLLEKYDLPFVRHTTGIEPILEQEASFEQSQTIDIRAALATEKNDSETNPKQSFTYEQEMLKQQKLKKQQSESEQEQESPIQTGRRSLSKLRQPTNIKNSTGVPIAQTPVNIKNKLVRNGNHLRSTSELTVKTKALLSHKPTHPSSKKDIIRGGGSCENRVKLMQVDQDCDVEQNGNNNPLLDMPFQRNPVQRSLPRNQEEMKRDAESANFQSIHQSIADLQKEYKEKLEKLQNVKKNVEKTSNIRRESLTLNTIDSQKDQNEEQQQEVVITFNSNVKQYKTQRGDQGEPEQQKKTQESNSTKMGPKTLSNRVSQKQQVSKVGIQKPTERRLKPPSNTRPTSRLQLENERPSTTMRNRNTLNPPSSQLSTSSTKFTHRKTSSIAQLPPQISKQNQSYSTQVSGRVTPAPQQKAQNNNSFYGKRKSALPLHKQSSFPKKQEIKPVQRNQYVPLKPRQSRLDTNVSRGNKKTMQSVFEPSIISNQSQVKVPSPTIDMNLYKQDPKKNNVNKTVKSKTPLRYNNQSGNQTPAEVLAHKQRKINLSMCSGKQGNSKSKSQVSSPMGRNMLNGLKSRQSDSRSSVQMSQRPGSKQKGQNSQKSDKIAKKAIQFNKIKKEIEEALLNIGISDQKTIWDEDFILDGKLSEESSIYLSRQQIKKVMVHMKYLTFSLESEKESPRTNKLLLKLQKLETYQFEDLMLLLLQRRYKMPDKRTNVQLQTPIQNDNSGKSVVNVLSLVGFILLMNDVVRDWMLIEGKRPPRPVKEPENPEVQTQQNGKPISSIEQKLKGKNFLNPNDRKRKSVAQRRKEEEEKIKKLLMGVMQNKKKDEQSSSEESEEEETISGNYFMLRKKSEVGMIKEQFSYLLQNRTEQLEEQQKQQQKENNQNRDLLDLLHDSSIQNDTSHVKQCRKFYIGDFMDNNTKEIKKIEQDKLNLEFSQSSISEKVQSDFQSISLINYQSVQTNANKYNQKNNESKNYNSIYDMPLQMSNLDDIRVQEPIQVPQETPTQCITNITSEPSASRLNSLLKKSRSNKKLKNLLQKEETPPTSLPPNQGVRVTPSTNHIPKPTSSTMKKSLKNIKKQSPINLLTTQGSQVAKTIQNQTSHSSNVTPIKSGNKCFNLNSSQRNNTQLTPVVETKQKIEQINQGKQSQKNTREKQIDQIAKITEEEEEPIRSLVKQPEPQSLSRQRIEQDCISPDEPKVQNMINPPGTSDFPPQCLSNTKQNNQTDLLRNQIDQIPFEQSRQYGEMTFEKKDNVISNQKSVYKEEVLLEYQEKIDNSRTSHPIIKFDSNFNDNEPLKHKKFNNQIRDLDNSIDISQNNVDSPLRKSPTKSALNETLPNHLVSQSSEKSPMKRHSLLTSFYSGKEPILIVDVKLQRDAPEKLVVFENEDPEEVVKEFCKKHSIEETKQKRLLRIVNDQINEYYLDLIQQNKALDENIKKGQNQ